MNIILIHIGSSPPTYIWTCIEQIRRYFDGAIYIVTEGGLDVNITKYDVHWIPVKSFLNSERIKQFDDASFMNSYGHDGFWNLAFQRMFILEEVIRGMKLNCVLHIENDVLLFEDPRKLHFEDVLPVNRVTATPVGPKYCTYAYTYIPNFKAINELNTENLSILKQGKETLSQLYGEGMVNEMLIASDLRYKGLLDTFPVLPEGEASKYFNKFQSLFDGASWGQYVGGTPGNENSWSGDHHYVGKEIKHYDVVWEMINSFREPYVEHENGFKFKLNNLHIHSKNLERWR